MGGAKKKKSTSHTYQLIIKNIKLYLHMFFYQDHIECESMCLNVPSTVEALMKIYSYGERWPALYTVLVYTMLHILVCVRRAMIQCKVVIQCKPKKKYKINWWFAMIPLFNLSNRWQWVAFCSLILCNSRDVLYKAREKGPLACHQPKLWDDGIASLLAGRVLTFL